MRGCPPTVTVRWKILLKENESLRPTTYWNTKYNLAIDNVNDGNHKVPSIYDSVVLETEISAAGSLNIR